MRTICTVLLAAALLGSAAADSEAGTLDFVFDLDTPAASDSGDSPGEPIDTSSGLAFSLGYLPRTAFEPGHPLRMGVSVGRRSIEVAPHGSYGEDQHFTEFRMQGRAVVDVVRRRRIALSAELAVGLALLSDDIPCSGLFCELPGSATIVTPAVRASIRVSSRVALVVDFKYPAFLNDRRSTFPFESGAVIGVGLEVSGYRGEGGA